MGKLLAIARRQSSRAQMELLQLAEASEHTGLKKSLQPEWRGGVMCRVISGGSIAVNDIVTLLKR